MSKIIVTADSTCDLDQGSVDKYGIVICPLYVRTGEGEYRDGVDITAAKLFEYVSRTGQLPKTAACSVEDYLNLWRPYVEAGNEVVHIDISGEFSSCYQNACLAAQELGNVYPVDSRNLSSGSGHLAIEAAILADEGKSGREIQALLDEKKQRLNVSFVIDTMEYLAKGGRCSSVVSLAAGILKIKPMIEVRDGKMGVGKKYRGKMSAVLRQYVHERLQAAGPVELKRIFITDSGVDPDIVEECRKAILEEAPFEEIIHSLAGCTVSSHCGPGTLGILFFQAEK